MIKLVEFVVDLPANTINGNDMQTLCTCTEYGTSVRYNTHCCIVCGFINKFNQTYCIVSVLQVVNAKMSDFHASVYTSQFVSSVLW